VLTTDLETACCNTLSSASITCHGYEACAAIPTTLPGFAPLATSQPSNVVGPSTHPARIAPPVSASSYLMQPEQCPYASDQRLTIHHDYRDVALPNDDIETQFSYDGWSCSNAGKQLTETRRTDAAGNVLNIIDRSSFDGHFNEARTVTETGANACASQAGS